MNLNKMGFKRYVKSKIKDKKTLEIFFLLTAIGRFLGVLTHLVLFLISVSFFDYISNLQEIFFYNSLVEHYEITCFIVFISIGLCCYFYGGMWFLKKLKKSLLCINLLLFVIAFCLWCLHEEALSPELVIIPIIGLAIIKTKWTEEQLQKFFEEFQEGINYIFTEEEKMALIQMALNPLDLKEKMMEEIVRKLEKSPEDKTNVMKAVLCIVFGFALFLCVNYIG